MTSYDKKPVKTPEEEKGFEQIPMHTQEQLAKILESKAPELKAAIEALPEAEIKRIIGEAAEHVTNDTHRNQYFLGGGFVDEQGNNRDRELLSLDIPEQEQVSPFLKYLVLKVVKQNKANVDEIYNHKSIQEKAEHTPGIRALRVPRIIEVVGLPNGYMGIVMERLPKNETNMSLQTLVENMKKNGLPLKLSDSLRDQIDRSFADLHGLGYTHGDIQDGNVYLTDIILKEYTMPSEPKRKRPKKVVIAFSANVMVIDFERVNTNADKAGQIEEMSQVQQMTDFLTLDVSENSKTEEIVEAWDEWFDSHQVKRA